MKKLHRHMIVLFVLGLANIEAKDILDNGMALGAISVESTKDDTTSFSTVQFSMYSMSGDNFRYGTELNTISLLSMEFSGRAGYAINENTDIWVNTGIGSIMFASFFWNYGVGMHYAFNDNWGLIFDVKKYIQPDGWNSQENDSSKTKKYTSYGLKVSFDW